MTDTESSDAGSSSGLVLGQKKSIDSRLVRLGLVLAIVVAGSLGVAVGWAVAVTGDSSDGPPTKRNSADIGFLQEMTTHHHQAVLMTQLAGPQLEPLVSPLAMSIQGNQLVQIGQMQGWLQLWKAPAQPSEAGISWMGGDSQLEPMHGMADQSELDALATAVGRDANLLFLQLMIRHHRGGIDMATAAARMAGTDEVQALASTMVAEEARELEYMAALLDRFGGTYLPDAQLSSTSHSHPN